MTGGRRAPGSACPGLPPSAGESGGSPASGASPSPDPAATDRRYQQLFWLWACLHGLLWILVPAWVQPSGHRDVIELVNWGHHPAWGYWKHPPLQPWVADLAVRLAGGRLVGVYVAAQVSLTACLWAVWRLGRDVLPPRDALLGVLLLEGIVFYNYNSPKFNHDALQLPLWAWIGLCAWRAVTRGGPVPWLGLGLAAGLGVLSKYSVVFLLGPVVAFVLVRPDARRSLRTPGPWLGLGLGLLLVLPHVAWLVGHGFPTIVYGLGRARGHGRLLDHVGYPLSFAANHAATVAPLLGLAGLLGLWPKTARRPAPASSLARPFLLTLTLAPVLGYLAVSALTGLRLLSGWGTPLWSYLGVALLLWRRPSPEPRTRRRVAIALASLSLGWLGLFAGHFALGPWLGYVRPEHFPGPRVAEVVTEAWRARFGRPLPVVAGDRGFADPVGFYSPDRPDVYELDEPDPVKNLGVDDTTLRRRGGVLVWNARVAGPSIPAPWGARFPGVRAEPIRAVPWLTRAPVPPVELGWALVAPAEPP
jgi:dolichyl-phosphate-mannose-protein mannosyltransferase